MYNFFVDLLIWSFAIYGFIKFMDEYIWDIFCYIISLFIGVTTFFKKFVAKLSR